MTDETVVLGRISGVFGVKGWVKVFSHTDPRNNILRYKKWLLKEGSAWREVKLSQGQVHGKGVIAKLEGVDDRDQAASLMDTEIAIQRDVLPNLQAGEYYWADLIGLDVQNLQTVDLGTVDHLFETGANDVLVVKGERERLIPYVPEQVIVEIDLAGNRLVVDWDEEF